MHERIPSNEKGESPCPLHPIISLFGKPGGEVQLHGLEESPCQQIVLGRNNTSLSR